MRPVLLPSPQRITELEGRYRFADGDPTKIGAAARIDPIQVSHEQGYILSISPAGIRLAAHDQAGAFYGAMTLRQIARQAVDGALPCMVVEDWPDFPHRGVMLDISRDRVPTMETLYSLVDMLAEWKINQFQLYTEHTFAYSKHREVWEGWSPMTGEEIMELDAYCRKRHVELVPNQNSFGHMEKWLVHLRYRRLGENPEPDVFLPQFGVYGTLCPTEPAVFPFLDGLYDELLPHFSSGLVNVCCDEARIGIAGSNEICEKKGKGRVYLDYILKIHDLVQKRGRKMQFWGDVIVHHPYLVPELREGMIPIIYGYDPDTPYAQMCAPIANNGSQFYVGAGTNTWWSIGGRSDIASANIRLAARSGLECGAAGCLVADWGDYGHWQHLPVSYPALAYAAATSWAVNANVDIDLAKALDLHVFHDSAGIMGKMALDLGNAYQQPGVEWRTHLSVLAQILIRHPSVDGSWDRPLSNLTVESLGATGEYIGGVVSRLGRVRMARPDADLIADEFRNNAMLLQHACHMWSARINAVGRDVQPVPWERINSVENTWPNRPSDGEIARDVPPTVRRRLNEELAGIVEEYKTVWLARNRPGGLDDSIGRFEKLQAEYRRLC